MIPQMAVELNPDTLTLEEQVTLLHSTRQAYAAQKAATDDLLQDMRDNYAAVFDREADLKKQVSALEDIVRTRATGLYLQNPELGKQVAPGVTITVSKAVDVIYDTDEALAWAKEHDLCLMLDATTFEALAKAGQVKGDWLKVEEAEKIGTRIDKDLTKALEG